MYRLRVLLGFLIIIGIVAAAAPIHATVRITPLTAAPGESHVIYVEADCAVSGCSALDIILSFDPTIFQVDELLVGPSFGDDVYFVENTIDNANGILRVAAVSIGNPPMTDDPTLLEIHVTMLKPGTTPLLMDYLDLGDMEGNPIPVEFVPSMIEVLDSPLSVQDTATCEYTVKSGDTLQGIAIGNQVTVDAIMSLNDIENPRYIFPGQKLIVPASDCKPGVGGNTNIVEVHSCKHLGANVFEWYSVRVQYNSAGNPVGETRVGGPFTGAWRPGCPEGERPQQPSSGGNHSNSSGGSRDDDDNGGPNPTQPPGGGCCCCSNPQPTYNPPVGAWG